MQRIVCGANDSDEIRGASKDASGPGTVPMLFYQANLKLFDSHCVLEIDIAS